MFKAISSIYKHASGIFLKVFLVVFVFTFIVQIFAYFAFPQKPQYKQTKSDKQMTREQIYSIINNPEYNKTKENRGVIDIYRFFTCTTIGEGCTKNPSDGDKYIDKSLLGGMTNLIVAPFKSPPASGTFWVFNGIQHAGFIPQSLAAQGIGFTSLQGYMQVWTVFRNFAYFILVLVIVAIGFMIMFRVKISPQAVITAESALPRIVIALLMITFSYAIAGFLIDIMYMIIAFAVYIFSQFDLGTSISSTYAPTDPYAQTLRLYDLQNKFINARFMEIWPYGTDLFSTGAAMFNIIPDVLRGLLQGVFTIVLANFLTRVSTGPISTFADALSGIGVAGFTFGNLPRILGTILSWITLYWIAGLIPGLILGIIMWLTIFLLLFRLFFMLLASYIKILLFILFSPVILMFQAIPGRNTFGFWIKNIFAELLTFPALVVITLTGATIVHINMQPNAPALTLPFLGGFNARDFNLLVGTGLIMITPDLLKKMKEMLGVKDLGLNLGPGIYFGSVQVAAKTAAASLNKYQGLRTLLYGTKAEGLATTANPVGAKIGGFLKQFIKN